MTAQKKRPGKTQDDEISKKITGAGMDQGESGEAAVPGGGGQAQPEAGKQQESHRKLPPAR